MCVADEGVFHIIVVVEQAVHIIVGEIRFYLSVINVFHDFLHGEPVTRSAAFFLIGVRFIIFFKILLVVIVISGKKIDILRVFFELIKLTDRFLVLFVVEVVPIILIFFGGGAEDLA